MVKTNEKQQSRSQWTEQNGSELFQSPILREWYYVTHLVAPLWSSLTSFFDLTQLALLPQEL